MKEERWSR